MTPEELDRVMNPWLYTGQANQPAKEPKGGELEKTPPGVLPRPTANSCTVVVIDPPRLHTAAGAAGEARETLRKAVSDLDLVSRVAISAMRDEFTSGDMLDMVFTEWLGHWSSMGERLGLAGTRLTETAASWKTTERANTGLFGG